MTQANNIPLKYKGQTIWTNSRLLRIFTLLLTGETRIDNPSSGFILKSFYIEFNFERIFQDERQLKNVKELIERINKKTDNKDFLILNNLGQRIASILKSITPNISNNELSNEITDLTSIRPDTIKELFIQIQRLLNEEEIFKTEENISINSVLGRWESKTIFDNLEFDINFNMTDFSPSQKVNLLVSQTNNENYSIIVSIPALAWSTNKTVELKLINGNVLLDKGVLKITEADKSKAYKIPITRADSGLLETYLFKTKIIFEKINAR